MGERETRGAQKSNKAETHGESHGEGQREEMGKAEEEVRDSKRTHDCWLEGEGGHAVRNVDTFQSLRVAGR